jgi:hypothetical protein
MPASSATSSPRLHGTEANLARFPDEVRESVRSRPPSGRLSVPDDVAPAVVFLGSQRTPTSPAATCRLLRKRNPPPFGFRTEETLRPDKSIKYYLYAIIQEESLRELSLPVGDAIQNIRSALDHLIYELATPRGRRSRRLQFPIFTDECGFKVLSPPLIQSITGDERTLIERVEPMRLRTCRAMTRSPSSANSRTETSTACSSR